MDGCYVLTFDLFQGDAPEGSDAFQWPVIERDRVGGLRLIIWDKVKVLLCQYRLMHRKKVTSELHDSYFHLMTITHSISKIQWAIVWALNYYLTQLSSSPRSSSQEGSRQLETRCSWESHTRPSGPSETPIELTSPSGEQERHNVAFITVGSRYYSLCSVSSSLSHATFEQPFRTLTNKVRGKYNCKEVFLRLPSFLLPSFMRLCHCVCFIIVSLWCCWWLYNNILPERRGWVNRINYNAGVKNF